jgi:endonuclease/exonuclease/phosphatase family metal-dependent hydrolase
MINPAQIWHLTFLGLAYPVLLLGNILFTAYWAIKKNRYFLFSLGCILVGFGYLTSFFGWHFFKSTSQSENRIIIMTYNIGGLKNFRGDSDVSKENKMEILRQMTAGSDPQILCVQEGDGLQTIEALKKTFGFSTYFKEKSAFIYSKFPFTDKGIVPFDGETTNSCLWADLKTPAGIVRVYNVHLQSNQMSQTANRIATSGDLRERRTWRDIRFVMQRYKRAVIIRAEQARAVAKHIAKSPYPVILCGDFNDPPVSYVYRLLSKGLQDTFMEKGVGIGSTFAGKLPALRIDYVLPGPSFKVNDHRILDVELSDHFPVLVKLSIGD